MYNIKFFLLYNSIKSNEKEMSNVIWGDQTLLIATDIELISVWLALMSFVGQKSPIASVVAWNYCLVLSKVWLSWDVAKHKTGHSNIYITKNTITKTLLDVQWHIKTYSAVHWELLVLIYIKPAILNARHCNVL